jgi:hypothetical protein
MKRVFTPWAKFTPRGEVHPWGPGVKLRMALWMLESVAGLTMDNDPELVADDGRVAVGRDAHDLAGIDLTCRPEDQGSSVEARACGREAIF